MRILASILIALPLPALADDICHDLWFTRNLIMDRAGYCFGSILGKSTFDNGDCTGKSVALGTAATEMVARIQASEKELACKVDTGQPVLDLEDADFRRTLTDLPLRSPFESACIGCGPGVSDESDQVTVSAINRNFPGRSGPGQVYLASPRVVAASALAGYIATPETLFGS